MERKHRSIGSTLPVDRVQLGIRRVEREAPSTSGRSSRVVPGSKVAHVHLAPRTAGPFDGWRRPTTAARIRRPRFWLRAHTDSRRSAKTRANSGPRVTSLEDQKCIGLRSNEFAKVERTNANDHDHARQLIDVGYVIWRAGKRTRTRQSHMSEKEQGANWLLGTGMRIMARSFIRMHINSFDQSCSCWLFHAMNRWKIV